MIAVKPDVNKPMFLFAVTNPLETVVQLGVSLRPGETGSTNVSLLYTDSERHMTTQTVASFLVPEFTKKWTRYYHYISYAVLTLSLVALLIISIDHMCPIVIKWLA